MAGLTPTKEFELADGAVEVYKLLYYVTYNANKYYMSYMNKTDIDNVILKREMQQLITETFEKIKNTPVIFDYDMIYAGDDTFQYQLGMYVLEEDYNRINKEVVTNKESETWIDNSSKTLLISCKKQIQTSMKQSQK